MDNLSHTLIGLVAGASIAHATRTRGGALSAGARRGLFVTLAAVGGNLPDADLILSYGQGARDKLSYLLEHRGYTHTVIGCVVLALLLYACAEGWARYKRYVLTLNDRLALLGMAVLGTLLHLLMDSLNSYGVHPFWPFNNAWLYGDSVFIVEPCYWLATAPMFFVVRTMLARVAIALAVILAVALGIFVHLSQPAWWVGIVLVAAGLFFVGKRASVRTAALTSAAVMVIVTVVFAGAGRVASAQVESIAAKSFPAARGLDHVLSPMPMNPLCWDVLLVQTEAAQYTVRHGLLSTVPGVIAADHCTLIRGGGETTAPMTPVSPAPAVPTREIRWFGEFSMDRSRLVSVLESDCGARALMQFARAPFASAAGGQVSTATRWIVGDLRFDGEPGLGFAEIALDESTANACRLHMPWTPPRADLMEQRVSLPSGAKTRIAN